MELLATLRPHTRHRPRHFNQSRSVVQHTGSVDFRPEPRTTSSDPTEISPPSPESDPVHLDTYSGKWPTSTSFTGDLRLDAGGDAARPNGHGTSRQNGRPAPHRDRNRGGHSVGYDPHSMMWTTVPSSDSGPELPQPFKSAALAAAVARREQASNALLTPKLVPAPQLSRRLRRAPRARSRGRSGLCGNLTPTEAEATDFVVVLKPRTELSLATVFPENGAGRALIAHLGAIATRLVTVVMFRHPSDQCPCSGTCVRTLKTPVIGVVTVRSSDIEATLRESLYWPEGKILHVRRLGTSNKVKPRYVSYDALLIPVQRYKKTVPACCRCGSVGHRPDSCPGPKPDLCGICGKAVPLTDGARAPHECTPTCALGALEDAATQITHSATGGSSWPQEAKTSTPTETEEDGPRASPQRAQPPATNPTPPPHPDAGAIGPYLRGQTPDGPRTMKSTTRQVSPASPKPHPPSPEPKPTAKGDLSWATRVRQGPSRQPFHSTREQIAIRQLQAQVASLTQAVEALANRLPSANPTPSGQAPEAMDSGPSEHRDTTAPLASIKARVSSLEAHMASIVTTIKTDWPPPSKTVVDLIRHDSCPVAQTRFQHQPPQT
ncbi:hypothetical protein HPB49_017212 [Dermacentor silvarum]|uniref:Uncharacterized protein n=1 Tax=Dermacentor silvarum TaxID=543639 RepID=A0ACB8CG77_DERSI|nr:hypothetical protein HPB49_017212 [Dermacentor silvarum]